MNRYGRGKSYSKEEDEKLLRLYDDNSDDSLTSTAEKAVAYGICKYRSANAIVQHLSDLIKRRESPTDDEQIDIYEELERGETKYWERRYKALLEILIGGAELYQRNYYKGLKFDYIKIAEWLAENESERVKARIEELESEEK